MVMRGFLPLLLLCGAALLTAENSISAELRNQATAARGEDGVSAAGVTQAELSFRSTGNRDVKGELVLNADVGETAVLDIHRAYIKSRFPGLRLTMGKTRLSWGEGFLFNAGDLLFGSTGTGVDLTADELRTAGKWLGAVNIPLGRFSFAELVYLPPQGDLLDYRIDSRLYSSGASSEEPELSSESVPSGGGRIVLKPLGVKTEAGYYYNAPEESHDHYLSLQGNLFVDWHLSAGTSLAAADPTAEEWLENLAISFGLSHMLRVGYDTKLNMRLEGLFRPEAAWQAESGEEYGIYLYPELNLIPDDRKNIFYRAVVSPVDISAVHTLGGSWNIYQDFDLLTYAGFNSGESGDTFAWDAEAGGGRYPGWFVTLGCEFTY